METVMTGAELDVIAKANVERIKVDIGRKHYVVVRYRSDKVISRIEAMNVVNGVIHLNMQGRTAKAVLKQLAANEDS